MARLWFINLCLCTQYDGDCRRQVSRRSVSHEVRSIHSKKTTADNCRNIGCFGCISDSFHPMGTSIVHQGNIPDKLVTNFLSDYGFCYSVNSSVLKYYIFSIPTKKTLQLATDVIQRRAKTNQQITCMLVFVVVAFYFVWIPYHVVYFLSALCVKILTSY